MLSYNLNYKEYTLLTMNKYRIETLNVISQRINNQKDCINIEKSIFNFCVQYAESKDILRDWEAEDFVHLYKLKSLNIINRIKTDLIDTIDPKTIALLSPQELNPSFYAHNKELSPEDVEDGLFECKKCFSKKTTYYSLQTRSADEPMTNFITCVVCKNRWKM